MANKLCLQNLSRKSTGKQCSARTSVTLLLTLWTHLHQVIKFILYILALISYQLVTDKLVADERGVSQ